jgi:hypothetical protein
MWKWPIRFKALFGHEEWTGHEFPGSVKSKAIVLFASRGIHSPFSSPFKVPVSHAIIEIGEANA